MPKRTEDYSREYEVLMKTRSIGCMSFQIQFRLDKDVFRRMSCNPNGVETWYNIESDCLALFSKPCPTTCLPFGKSVNWWFIGHLVFERIRGEMRINEASSKYLLQFFREFGLHDLTNCTELVELYKHDDALVLMFLR